MKPSWPRRKLGEIADLCLGKMLDQNKNKGEYHPYLANINVRWGTFDLENLPRMRFESHEHDRYGLKSGDLVVCEGGEPGRCALWKNEVPNMKFQKALHRVRPYACLDSRYLLYWFLRAGKMNWFNQYCTGATIKHLPGEKLAIVEIDVPPLPLQRRITSILSPYDELTERSQRRICVLEAMAQSLFREWFVNFKAPGCGETKPVKSSLGPIPHGWEVKTVPECIFVNPHTVVPREGEKPFVPMTSLSAKSMLITDIESRCGNSGAKFRNGDTLFARITPCLENGKTGFVQFLTDNQPVAFGSTEFIVLRGRTVTPEFVYCLARSDEFRRHAIKSMTGATGRQRVQDACFAQFKIPEPPRELLDRFSAIVSPSFRLIQTLHLQIQNLRRTRDLLLPRLLSGLVAIGGKEE